MWTQTHSTFDASPGNQRATQTPSGGTTESNHSNPVAPHLLNRDFTASAPNTKWVTDITAIETAEGDLYLAGVVDIYSRMVVGWAMGNQRDEQLGTSALMMAVVRRRPHPGLLHHSDRGSQ